jgi:hypothetical protein
MLVVEIGTGPIGCGELGECIKDLVPIGGVCVERGLGQPGNEPATMQAGCDQGFVLFRWCHTLDDRGLSSISPGITPVKHASIDQ